MTRQERKEIKDIAKTIKGRALAAQCFCTNDNGIKNFGIHLATPHFGCKTQNPLNAKHFLQMLKNNDPALTNAVWAM